MDSWARRWCALEQLRARLVIEQAGLLARLRHVLPAGTYHTRTGIAVTVAVPRRRAPGDRSGRLRHDVWLDIPEHELVPSPRPARHHTGRTAPVVQFSEQRPGVER